MQPSLRGRGRGRGRAGARGGFRGRGGKVGRPAGSTLSLSAHERQARWEEKRARKEQRRAAREALFRPPADPVQIVKRAHAGDAERKRKRRRQQCRARLAGLDRRTVRPSAVIDLEDEDFLAKFTGVWKEHIDGFGTNKRREKQKKDMTMEWRVRLKEKQERLRKEGIHV